LASPYTLRSSTSAPLRTSTVPPGSSSGAKLRVKGHGVRGPGEPGDLFAELEVMLPPDLTEADRRDLAAIACRYHDNPRGGLAW
jgi:DnaJ-class molecular chaperone